MTKPTNVRRAEAPIKGWSLHPIWGLEMAEHGFGVGQPLFGDATIVSRSFVRNLAPKEPLAQEIFSGSGIREVFEQSGVLAAGPAPIEQLVEIPPGAFIAVRREAAEDAHAYAESIRALLTASYVLTAGQAPKGFALSSLPLHWTAATSRVYSDGDGLKTERRVTASYFVHLTPIRVTHKAFRESWENRTAIVGSWRLHKDDAFSRALVGPQNKLSGLRRRIREAGITLGRAMESTHPSLSTLFGTVALESLLRDGSASFADAEAMAASVFSSSSGPTEISRLFANRHKVAHEATTPESETEHAQEIAAAWGVLLMAAMAAEDLKTVEDFRQHLRNRVLAGRVAKTLRDKGETDLADQLELVATYTAQRASLEKEPSATPT